MKMGKVIIIESKREEGQGQAAQVCSKGSNLLFTFVLFLAFALLFLLLEVCFRLHAKFLTTANVGSGIKSRLTSSTK